MAKPASPAGTATRRSLGGCVITGPRLRKGVPDSQLKAKGTIVSGSSRPGCRGSWRAIDAEPPRPWKRPRPWPPASNGKGRRGGALAVSSLPDRLRLDGPRRPIGRGRGATHHRSHRGEERHGSSNQETVLVRGKRGNRRSAVFGEVGWHSQGDDGGGCRGAQSHAEATAGGEQPGCGSHARPRGGAHDGAVVRRGE